MSDRTGRSGGSGRSGPWLAVVLAVVAVAASLRSPLTSVPPLAADLDGDLGLGAGALGLLTALPVLCMGLLAPPASALAARIGLDRAIAVGAVAVAVGTCVRPWGGAALLVAGTTLAGAGIAVVGALVPAAVKRHVPHRPGAVTGAYMASMMTTATLAAAVAVPLATALGWRVSLAVWALPAVLGAVVWLARSRPGAPGSPDEPGPARSADPAVAADPPAPTGLPWRSRTAWLVTAYLTCCSVSFYTLMAWVAPAYVERGWSDEAAGVLLAVFSGGQLAAALVVPALVDRVRDRRAWYAAPALANAAGLVVLVTAPDAAPWVVVGVLGVANGAAFSLGLTQLVEHAAGAHDSARLGGLGFGVSYAVAAAGPVVAGWTHGLTGTYAIAFGAVALVALSQVLVASRLGPGRQVGAGAD
ncbi:MFS transporter [Nocardioides zeae]|uniref:MFS transporter n=1 Tax=Nocardioides imazamoxiresistens TaxID=3231893 RepID=A0ABU3PXY4_9ACTN|nr:MFS transporter [Nocardioides zeae]MDT9594019.1 MFS transporter [Nocardioides zeae]